MKIVHAEPDTYIVVETDTNERFERHGPDCWYQWLGESLEPVYFMETALEDAYQEYLKGGSNA